MNLFRENIVFIRNHEYSLHEVYVCMYAFWNILSFLAFAYVYANMCSMSAAEARKWRLKEKENRLRIRQENEKMQCAC